MTNFNHQAFGSIKAKLKKSKWKLPKTLYRIVKPNIRNKVGKTEIIKYLIPVCTLSLWLRKKPTKIYEAKLIVSKAKKAFIKSVKLNNNIPLACTNRTKVKKSIFSESLKK